MTARVSAHLLLSDESATHALAKCLADVLKPGDTVLLSGGIGSGKTALCRALIQTRMAETGRIEHVPSPTFTLVQTYDLPGGEIWHADLYRVGDPSEVVELGLDQAMSEAICLIEWPDRLGDLVPPDALNIELSLGASDTTRMALIEGSAGKWARLIAQLSSSLCAAS